MYDLFMTCFYVTALLVNGLAAGVVWDRCTQKNWIATTLRYSAFLGSFFMFCFNSAILTLIILGGDAAKRVEYLPYAMAFLDFIATYLCWKAGIWLSQKTKQNIYPSLAPL